METQAVKLNKIPLEGFQLLLEYENVTIIDLKNKELIKKEIADFFKTNNTEVAEVIELGDANTEYTLTFALDDGYLNCQCFPKQNNFVSFDLNIFEQSKQEVLDSAYTHFAKFFGNLQCKTSFYQQKGGDNKFLLNSNEFTSAIYKNMKIVHRQKSKEHEIRVFDNEFLGRILTIDDQIKLIGKIDNDYNKDMTREIIDEQKELERVLIIGGANTSIATYLLRQFSKIKKIVICDIDSEIIDVVVKFFANAAEIEKAIKEQKLELVYENGAKYAKDQAEKGEKFDAIIIDTVNSNQGNWNNAEKCIFTQEFYENLKKILKEGGKFSQQVVNDMIKGKFETNVKAAQLKVEYINSKTDDYGLDLPIGVCKL